MIKSKLKWALVHSTLVLFVTLGSSIALSQNGSNGQPFQELQVQIDALQAQIDALQPDNGPNQIDVDCYAGDSITAALDSAADSGDPVTISIAGICNESVVINRNLVTLTGASIGDGITTAGNSEAILLRDGASGITIENLTLTNSVPSNNTAVLGCAQGSQATITGTNISANGGAIAVDLNAGSSCLFSASVIEDATYGIYAQLGSNAVLVNSTVQNSEIGILALNNSNIRLAGGRASRNVITGNNTGIRLDSGSTLETYSADIQNNLTYGILLQTGAALQVSNHRFVVNNNGSYGVFFGDNTFLGAGLTTLIDITGQGVDIECAGQLTVNGSLTTQTTNIGTIGASCPFL